MLEITKKLFRNDFKIIGRDLFLIFMFFFVVYIAVALRYGLPWFNDYLFTKGFMPSKNISYSLSDIYPMILSYMTFFTASLLVGTIFGFVFIDEKDSQTIKAMLVTPVSLEKYIFYRVLLITILSFFFILGIYLFIDQLYIPFGNLILISFGGALTAPIVSLLFASFSENKIQGFAYSKFGGISGWIIMISWFIKEPLQYFFGFFPHYWIAKSYWLFLSGSGFWILALLLGIFSQVILIYLLTKKFIKVAYK